MSQRIKNPDIDLHSHERRQVLKASAAALVAGISGAMMGGQSKAFAADGGKRKVLIAYYSRTGNTKEIADQIQMQTGGDLFQLQTVHTYPAEYRATTDQAKRELERNFRPQLVSDVPNIASYDTIFVGYPNWWGTFPMAYFTFFEKYRFAGKVLIPFCTHEGSGLGGSVADMRKLCPNAQIREGIAIRGGNSGTVRSSAARQEVSQWLRQLNVLA